jgi:hypothetical protein
LVVFGSARNYGDDAVGWTILAVSFNITHCLRAIIMKFKTDYQMVATSINLLIHDYGLGGMNVSYIQKTTKLSPAEIKAIFKKLASQGFVTLLPNFDTAADGEDIVKLEKLIDPDDNTAPPAAR